MGGMVARAWLDPQYKQRLLANGTAAIAELGFGGPEGDHIVVVENTPIVHNVGWQMRSPARPASPSATS